MLFNIQLDEGDEYTVCRPIGELDAWTVGQFRGALGELANTPKLLIDMSEVPFVDSAGLGALIGGIRRAREVGGDVAVCCNRPTLVRFLHTSGFDRIVTVTETLDEAARSLVAVDGTADHRAGPTGLLLAFRRDATVRRIGIVIRRIWGS